MNIEKVKNYNQKLLAILGTVVVLMAIGGLISLTYFAITEIIINYRYVNQEEGILSDCLHDASGIYILVFQS